MDSIKLIGFEEFSIEGFVIRPEEPHRPRETAFVGWFHVEHPCSILECFENYSSNVSASVDYHWTSLVRGTQTWRPNPKDFKCNKCDNSLLENIKQFIELWLHNDLGMSLKAYLKAALD